MFIYISNILSITSTNSSDVEWFCLKPNWYLYNTLLNNKWEYSLLWIIFFQVACQKCLTTITCQTANHAAPWWVTLRLQPWLPCVIGPTVEKTWRHPQNRKYITHRNTTRRGPSHGDRQHCINLVKFDDGSWEKLSSQTHRSDRVIQGHERHATDR